jgi:hypothetical protein
MAGASSQTESQQLMQDRFAQANQLLHRQDYQRAILSFRYLVENANGEVQQDALEYVGVAYEQSGRLARAKTIYDQYLATYTKGDRVHRVRQRLAHLKEEQLIAQAPIITPVDLRLKQSQSRYHASINQFYYAGRDRLQSGQSESSQSILYTFINGDWRQRRGGTEYRGVIAGRHEKNYLGGETSAIDLKKAYLAFKSNTAGASFKFGRQRANSLGVSGRIDGIVTGYTLTSKLGASIVYGHPVQYYQRDEISTVESLYGANLSYLTARDRLQVDTYYLKHQNAGFDNRMALGSNLRWSDKKYNLYSSFDYDMLYKQFNLFNLQSDLTIGSINLFASYDNRRNPFLDSTNALMALADVDSIEDLHFEYSNSQIRNLTKQITGRSESYQAGFRYTLSKKLSVVNEARSSQYSYRFFGLDNVLQKQSSTTNSVSTRLVAQRYTAFRDVNVFNLKYIDTSRYGSIAMLLSSRWDVSHKWRLTLNYRYAARKMNSGETQWQAYPTVKILSRINRKMQAEFELGRQWLWYDGNTLNENYKRDFFSLGYVYHY